MKRYLVFIYEEYYPKGGWDDFQGDYDSLTEIYDALSDPEFRVKIETTHSAPFEECRIQVISSLSGERFVEDAEIKTFMGVVSTSLRPLLKRPSGGDHG